MIGDPIDCVSRGNFSWSRGNIFTKISVMKLRNLFSWRAMSRSTISCVVMVFLLRCKTTTAQQDTERLIDNIFVHILHARRLLIKYKYPLSSIIVMEETSIWNDMVSNTTIDKQEAKSFF